MTRSCICSPDCKTAWQSSTCCWPLMNVGFALAMLRRQDSARGRPRLGRRGRRCSCSCTAFAYFLHGRLDPAQAASARTIDALIEPGHSTPPLSVVAFALLLSSASSSSSRWSPGPSSTSILLVAGWAMTDPNFQRHHHQGRQRADLMLIFSVGFFTWLPLRGRHQRRAHRPRRAAAGEARRRQGAGLARPGLHRADLHGRLHVRPGRLGRAAQGAARAAGHHRQGPQPVEGAVVLPRPAGNARLLRSVDGRRGAADDDHRRPDRHALHRLQPEGQRLLHLRRSASSPSPRSCSASSCCG